ncbi:MAG TPA: TolC family protein [Vicinamibacterales bacterium]|nr:TolC family protein [Vicinamibacterales bacterium]
MKSHCTAIVLLGLLGAGSVASAQSSPIGLTLADAITRGLENSHRLAEIKAREEGAKAAVEVAAAADRPLVGASASYSRTNHVTEFAVPQPNGSRLVVYPDIPDNLLSRVSFQWPIFTSGRTDALERAAAAEAAAVGSEIEVARADLRFEISRAYWAVVTAREAVRVLDVSSERIDAQLKDAQQRFAVGLIPPNEVSTLEAQRARERAQRLEADNLHRSSIVELARLIGAPPGSAIEPTDSIAQPTPVFRHSNESSMVEEALSHRPELKALASRVNGAEFRERAVSSATKPTISLIGGVDYARPNPRIFPRKGEWQESWDVGVNVNWAFLDFGRTKAQRVEAAAMTKAARERLADVEAVISADVRQRLMDRDSAHAIAEAADAAVKSAIEARRVVAERFGAGVATSTDLIVAQVAQLETELARTRALANLRLAEARLERSMGGSR